MRLFLFALATSGLLAGFAFAFGMVLGKAGDPATLEAFESLEQGMPQARVERLLGSPYRRVQITRADGSLAQACFHEGLPVANENDIKGIALEYRRDNDSEGDRWILHSKVLARNTQPISFVDRLENAWTRAVALAGFRQFPTEEVKYDPAP